MDCSPVAKVGILALALAGFSAGACAQAWPSKPLRATVAFTAGSATDIIARTLGERLNAQLGQPVVVENRPGASGTIGAAIVARAEPDGYTLLGVAGGYTITPVVYSKLSYHPVKDFAPISLLVQAPFLLLTHPSLPVKSVKDLLALARAKPGALDCASAGHGTSTHMAFELFKALARVNISHVPYKGTGQSLVDAMSGQVHMLFGNVLSSLPHARAGRLRALAVTTARRSAVLPDLPTIAEAGVPGYENSTWHGWLAPTGTPPSILGRLNTELVRSTRSPDVVERLAPDGGEPVGSTPEQFRRHIADELARWGKLVTATGIRFE